MVLKSNRGFPALVDCSYEERRGIVFSDDRMELRFHLLNTALLPSLKAQTDFDFRLAILVTTNLPDIYLTELRRLIKDVPQAFIVPVPPSRLLRFGCMKAKEVAIASDAGRWATFRIDDDDALAAKYIARVRKHLDTVNATTALTFTKGVEYSLQGNSFGSMQIDNRPFSGAGLALLAVDDWASNNFPTVYQLGAHRNVAQHVPAIRDGGVPAFLRLLHDSNVSRATLRPNARNLSETEKAEVMGRCFPTINIEEIADQGPTTDR